MMKSFTLVNLMFLAAAGMFVLPAEVCAQQSVASAQEFLVQSLRGQEYRTNMQRDPQQLTPHFNAITSVQTFGHCDTRITHVEPAPYSNTHQWTAENLRYLSEVRQQGNIITFAWSHLPGPRQFRVSSEAMAARIAYALEYLRTECDAASATGF